MLHYNSYRSALKARFGKPVVTIPINGGFSCPNRDGVKSLTGCHFCDNRSFSPAAAFRTETPVAQLRATITLQKKHGCLYLPYLQPFSNTYAPVDRLKDIYEPLLSVPDVVGLAIGTRPDCFDEAIHRYLAQLAQRTYLSIELGLQSSHESTLVKCNRGHTVDEFQAAAERLSAQGIDTVAHVILGLPGETAEMMMQTARFLACSPCKGVKIHQLMIIGGTVFEKMYHNGHLSVLTLEEYASIVASFISLLRPDQELHRIMADATVKNGLVAPLWSANKMKSLQVINDYMEKRDLWQGTNYRT